MEVYAKTGTPVIEFPLFVEVMETPKDTWHKKNKNIQHISQLVLCGLKTAKGVLNPIKPGVKSRQAFYSGNNTHKKAGKKYVFTFPMSVLEFPVEVVVYAEDGKIRFKIRGKIDILDIEQSRLIDIKSSNENAMRWIVKGSSKAPPGAKYAHIIQVIVYWYIWNYKIIRDPKSRYWIKECGIMYVDWRYNALYCPIPLDIYNAEKVYNQLVTEAIGVHKAVNLDDWHYLNDKWHYDPEWWLCKAYCDYRSECKT